MNKDFIKEWKLIFLWGNGVGVFFSCLFIFEMQGGVALVPKWIAFIPPAFILLWGIISGFLFGNAAKRSFLLRYVIIKRPIKVFIIALLVFLLMFSLYLCTIDHEYGYIHKPFFQSFFAVFTMNFSLVGFYIAIPIFAGGYITGFIPSFLIRHALQLYRKHLKHILEPC